MDRFKFRVWRIKENCYNHQEPFPTCCMQENGLLAYFNEERQMQNYIVEQCTGLKDINGKLIYEGDILKDNHGRIARVYWSVTWCEFEVVYTHNNTGTIYSFTDWAYEKRCRTEIIGNIHENKDLLEE